MVTLCHPAWVKCMRVIGHHWNVCIILYLLSGACNKAHKEDWLILPAWNMRPHTPEARHLIWVIWEPFGFVFMLVHSPWHVFLIKGIRCIDWEINHLWNKSEQKSGISVPPVKEEKLPPSFREGRDLGKGMLFAKLLFPFTFHMKHCKGIRAECFFSLTLNPMFRILCGSYLHWNLFHFAPGTKKILVICLRFWTFRHDQFAWHPSVRATSPSWCTHVQDQGKNEDLWKFFLL